MDWVWMEAVALLVLNGIFVLIWKPWAGAYAGEKGKNYARKEDLDAILAEVRAVTATQKNIEARISIGLWRDQKRWEESRDAYARVLEWSDKLFDSLTDISPKPTDERAVTMAIVGAVRPLGGEFRRARAIAQIFLTPDATEPLASLYRRLLKAHTLDEAVETLRVGRDSWIDSAKSYFGRSHPPNDRSETDTDGQSHAQ